jgi:dienelactone hydrolase
MNPAIEFAQHDVHIGEKNLPGLLTIPGNASALVIFAHGSGSSRLSPRNIEVADALNRRRLGTLLFDLLTEDEARDRANVFDIPLLGRRVVEAVRWSQGNFPGGVPAIGLFGASTGAAAALTAASEMTEVVAAVVSRGGRPDLAETALDRVRAPTLLIVGGADHQVLQLNERALRALATEKELRVVPEATHLFEEPGALVQVIEYAGDWFEHYLLEARQR